MKSRGISLVVALFFCPALLWAQDNKIKAKDPSKTKDPTVIFRLQSLDGLFGNFRYLAAQAGRENEARQLEILFKAFTGDKGLEGLDTKKPMGMYGSLGPNFVDSDVVIMLPVADEKTILATIKRFGLPVDKDKKGIYTVAPEFSPVPFFFVFTNGYVYATARTKSALDSERLLTPAKILPPEKVGVASVSLNLGDLPKEIRDLVNGQMARELSNLTEKRVGEGDAEHQLRKETVENFAKQAKIFIDGAGTLSIKIDVNQKSEKIKFDYELGARHGTELAKLFAGLESLKSSVAGIISDSAVMSGVLRVDLPQWYSEGIQKLFKLVKEPLIEDANNEVARKYAKALLNALEPATKMKEVDLAFNMSGPNAKGLYTISGGARVNKALGIEKVIREAMKDNQIPQEIKDHLTVDALKVGDVQIHRLNVGQALDGQSRKVFGKSPVYLAFRENEVFFAMGAEAEASIKSAVSTKSVATIPARFTVSVARLAPLIETQRAGAIKAAEKVFGKNAQHDRVSYTVKGGASVHAQFSIDVKLIKFLAALQKSRVEE